MTHPTSTFSDAQTSLIVGALIDDSMGLYLLLFMLLFLKVKRSESRRVGRKWTWTQNSYSWSFKVIHFAISCRPTRGSISPYNTVVLLSEILEEVATYIDKNCRRWHPHCNLTPLPTWTFANIRMHLILPETSHSPTFLSLTVWVYLHSNLCTGLQKRHLFCKWVRFGRSRSSKVDDFDTNRQRVCDFRLVRHCDYGPIWHHFSISEIRRLIG